MGTQAERLTVEVQHSSGTKTRKIYRPSHGEIVTAMGTLAQKDKRALVTALDEAGGVLSRAKYERNHHEVTDKVLNCINGHLRNSRLHFHVDASRTEIWFGENVADGANVPN